MSLTNRLLAADGATGVNIKHKIGSFVSIVLVGALFTGVCFAQFSGSVQGTVSDPSGAGVPGATVRLLNTATQVADATKTESSGGYTFVSLAPGSYQISAEAPGFVKGSVTFTLTTGQNLSVPVTLTISTGATSVEVSAQAPVLNTAESRTEMTLEQQTISSIPLSGRTILNLATLAPGVSGRGAAATGSPGSGVDNFSTEQQVDASANGRGSIGNQYVVDGLDITSGIRPGVLNLSPNPDTIQETSIQANTFSVQYGRSSSLQMLLTTKSGTDRFHGNASDYFTNQRLAAGSEFVHNYAPYHSNNVSGTIGGPILPKKQFFFFFGIEPLRSSTSTGNSVTTFESPQFAAFAAQAFPNSVGTKLLTSYPTGNATITGVSKTAADVFPGTCGTAATANLPCNLALIDTGVFNGTNYRNAIQYNVRIDKYFKKDRIYGNYYRTILDTGGPSIRPAFTATNHFVTNSSQGNETHTFSPSTLNEASFGFVRVEGIQPQTGKFGVPVVSVSGQSAGIGTGFAQGDFIQHNYHWRDVLSHIHGAHSLKFGYDGSHGDDVALFASVYSQPSFSFNNLLALVQDLPQTSGNLAYNPVTGQPALGNYSYALTTHGVFAEDTWKVRRNVTLTYGIRWDNYGNPYPTGSTVLANFHLPNGVVNAGTVANGVMTQQKNVFAGALNNNWSPRFGAAWDVDGRGGWVVRGGFGAYHDWPTLGNDENGLKGNPPGFIIPTFLAGTTTAPVFALGKSDTYPYGFTYPTFPATTLDSHGGLVGRQLSVGGIDGNLKAPTVYIYTATLEHQLPFNLVASVGYSGSKSRNLIVGGGQTSATSYGIDVNRFAGDLITNNNVLTRLNHSFGSITYAWNAAEGSYNALIVGVRGRFGKRGSFNASYTNSQSNDDSLIYPTYVNLHQFWGPSPWDARNRVSMSWNYEIPGLHNVQRVARYVTEGWSLNGTTILQSGTPFTVTTNAAFQPTFDANGKVNGVKAGSGDYNADGVNFDIPNVGTYDVVANRQSYLHGLFTTSNFPTPALGSEGNEKWNQFRQPGYAQVNASLLKANTIREWLKLEFRFEVYNVLNRVNLGGVDGNLASGTFGRVTSQYAPRFIQLGANLRF